MYSDSRLTPGPTELLEKWIHAINRRDIEGIAACFSEDYEDEAPARRGESVRGRAHARKTFERLFQSMPDIQAELRAIVKDGDTGWMEWIMSGTRPDGSRMEFAGVNIFVVREGLLHRGRIYTELVRDAGGLDAQVDRMTSG